MEYPRVLLMHMTRVYQYDSANLMLRSLFGDWPKEKLAQVYTNRFTGDGDFCGHYYELGALERRFGRVFYRLKPAGMKAMSGSKIVAGGRSLNRTLTRRLARKVSSLIVESGMWETIFPFRQSGPLAKFILGFKPSIIYSQGHSLGFTNLALEISNSFDLPICYFPLDDWHESLHSKSPVHRKVDRVATAIARRASVRFALGPKMTERLTTRYGVPFDCLYHADDSSRFRITNPERNFGKRPPVFGYMGSLYLGRATSISDLLSACQRLNQDFKIRIYSDRSPANIPDALAKSPHVEFLPLPTHEELPNKLQECDLLFLPESFELKYRKGIELSLSTKCHLYMLSGRPIIVYGPSWSGTVDYARRHGWGLIVDKRNTEDLLRGIKKIMNDSAAVNYISTARDVARNNHNLKALRSHIFESISDISEENKHHGQRGQ